MHQFAYIFRNTEIRCFQEEMFYESRWFMNKSLRKNLQNTDMNKNVRFRVCKWYWCGYFLDFLAKEKETVLLFGQSSLDFCMHYRMLCFQRISWHLGEEWKSPDSNNPSDTCHQANLIITSVSPLFCGCYLVVTGEQQVDKMNVEVKI